MSFRALFAFEAALADYTGAPYVVVTDGCTHALELCFRYDQVRQTSFTAYTYLSVTMMLTHLGVDHTFTDQNSIILVSGIRLVDWNLACIDLVSYNA
jgi:dTDP-4-amino-4,6-dideoxygalactose transaminase